MQEVVRQGILPLLMTVSGYMFIEHQDQNEHILDQNYFLYDKTQSVFKVRNIKNQCVDLFSSLIEIFGDEAVINILKVVEALILGQEITNITGEKIYISSNKLADLNAIPIPDQQSAATRSVLMLGSTDM